MEQLSIADNRRYSATQSKRRGAFLECLCYGFLLPLGFAPFHFPGLAILGLALFYHRLSGRHPYSPFLSGLAFGLGFFGLGVSWLYISIHDYGHLNSIVSGLVTLLFILYLALFPALTAVLFSRLKTQSCTISSALLFSVLWTLTEFARSTFLTGFPWLLIGFGQFDSPGKFLLPIIGTFGLSLASCFAAALLSNSMADRSTKRYLALLSFLGIIMLPSLLSNIKWSEMQNKAVTIGVIQANLSMRDKWDENLFWQLLARYQDETEKLLGTDLIVMPESAIPLPPNYLTDYLASMDLQARQAGSAILIGIPQPTTLDESNYYNSMISLGKAKGAYSKQHLVPFGEYVPSLLQRLFTWLEIPDANMQPGKTSQPAIRVHKHPIASLICYELAYGNLLRAQLPEAEWIVSISDDGWFGHSLALYQQLQIAQVLSLETARYQVVSNNDGLSSLIDTQGQVVDSLPAFSSGLLKAKLYPAHGTTPWIRFGDWPVLIFCLFIAAFFLIKKLLIAKEGQQTLAAKHKRSYPYQLD
ncbi:apolipoprotein N-acyltransferase [Legionella dresdenensis]|uniref:Apolipoprotein N-acyltransferase n=1 Tax=Legionella dresdenensis TaxID=450200 RepID=A0ABV8CB79_9GAMM